MATLDELSTKLKDAATQHATKAVEADLLNCLDLFIETVANNPSLALQADIPADDSITFTTKLNSAQSVGLSGVKPAAPPWVEEFQLLVVRIRSDTGLKRTPKP